MADRELMTFLRRLGKRVRAIGNNVGLDLYSFSVVPDLEGTADKVQMVFTVDPDRVGVHEDTDKEVDDLEAMFGADDTEAAKAKEKERIDRAAELARRLKDPKGGLWE